MQINLSGCALCGAVTDLKLSHIIPKFVYRMLTKTGVGKLRGGMNPNIPMQDGEKHYMLLTCPPILVPVPELVEI